MRRSDLFRKATADTRTAWEQTRLASRLKQAKFEQLDAVLRHGSAEDISSLLLEIAHSPFGSVAAYLPINDGKIMKMCGYFMTALLEEFVMARGADDRVDLRGVQDAILHWLDEEGLPSRGGDSLREITRLIMGTPEVRVTLAAPFASPIEFSLLARDAVTFLKEAPLNTEAQRGAH